MIIQMKRKMSIFTFDFIVTCFIFFYDMFVRVRKESLIVESIKSFLIGNFSNRPIAKIFFIFFLESTFKNKLESKISEFLEHSLILNSILKLQRKLFKRVKTFENKRKEAF
jgi:hypothetical protein